MKLKTQFLLILLSIFFSTNTFSKEPIKSCDELLSDNQYEDALKTKKGEFKSAFCHGQANLRLNHFDNALSDFKLAGKLSKSDTDLFMADLLEGITLKEAKRFDDALLHLNNSFSHVKTSKPFMRLFLMETGETLLLLGRYDEAANTFLEAYQLAANVDERAANLNRVAFAYASFKNFTKAIEYGLKANLAFERTSSLAEYAESGINLGLYYLENNDLDSAERTLFKFERLLERMGGCITSLKFYMQKVNITKGNQIRVLVNLSWMRQIR